MEEKKFQGKKKRSKEETDKAEEAVGAELNIWR